MKKLRKWTIIFLLALPVMTLVGMRVGWWFVPKKPLKVLAMDKTGLTPEGQEKQPLFWVLNNDRYVRKNGLLYDGRRDYLGFFPLENKQYRVKDFQHMTETEIQHVVSNIDVTYYIGTAGVSADIAKHSGFVQRGMTEKDMSFLKKMKTDGKLIFAEFNTIASPTKANVRRDFENEFGIHWSGWLGQYFTSLDSTSTELPQGIINNYKKQHAGTWPFSHSGIVFIHEKGIVEVLDGKRDLINPVPMIHTFSYGINSLGMKKRMPYSYWFDIVQITDSTNHAISAYELKVNNSGQKLLNKNGIPAVFPAVIMHNDKDYKFYYFCGNYCDNKVPLNSSYFVGGQYLSLMLDGTSSNLFFYKLFQPMVSSILEQYSDIHH
ncbi:hypothetical protein QUH73_18695 [Labilibaculum sp. K2S]|uniref:hypothetical protein n=1 Tax=Labilibaculum sp. K2S TaxID=3056386 RepID=UPI0025A4BEB9|nr:hypothetical protein [Labilibaculum sp. K2S]MDM8161852.1 hypothetical protein [Labilibaculum sp. K2S]